MTVTNRLFLSVALSQMIGSMEPADCRAQEATAVRQVELEAQFVEFNVADITPLAAMGIVDVDPLCLRYTSHSAPKVRRVVRQYG